MELDMLVVGTLKVILPNTSDAKAVTFPPVDEDMYAEVIFEIVPVIEELP
jgi:hypothetical protein